ncbi:hypothetical protein FNV43_RR04262 [Rhamnella rubrinervis]|uniref:Very-long-chain (3R)-3-hydroxyacyl-CoA dehydratase n=1 Tax=Rhamnella rubrinervis TaxID=2594499 RepID=A0A8K0HJW4_9ROSA|nr:hypothetical protein FNV43_RR04262 [Rhamnella rubrinervis]
MPRFSNLYLFAYNSAQTIGWAIALSSITSSFISNKSFKEAYASTGDLISLLQTAAFVEVIHGAIGLVPSGALLPLMQWGGRTHFLLAIVRPINEVQKLSSVSITFLAWSLSEVIRYSHHALNCIRSCPYWITYIRYTAFIVLYPVGLLLGEMCLMYQALPYIKAKNLYANLFDHLPFSYYNFIRVLLLVYPFLWLKLYLHLFKQRRSKLGKHHEKKRK